MCMQDEQSLACSDEALAVARFVAICRRRPIAAGAISAMTSKCATVVFLHGATMTLLLDKASTRPGTHAIVIGIGRYPWLDGGKGKPRFVDHDGMGQLTSPPASARAFATWLLETYDNPAAPLASVELLLSDAKSQTFKAPTGTVTVEPALIANVTTAIRGWAKRSKHERDLLLFFFSGHGIAAAVQTTLLCEDYGSDELSPMSFGVDFNKLHIGLDRSTARLQCFFVDACRVGSSTILESFNNYGQPIIDPTKEPRPRPRQAPVFHATLAGQLAYGRKNKPSYFTEAVLRGMRGAGSDNSQDGLTWWVETDQLLRALPKLLPRIVKDPNEILPQPPGSDITSFPLHRLNHPPKEIPVDVSCANDDSTAEAILSWTCGATSKKRNKKSAEPWQLDLDEGRYTFRAELPASDQQGEVSDTEIRPHYRRITIPV